MLNATISEEQWKEYDELGYIKVGRVEASALKKLQDRIDAIMLGEADLDYDKILMQLDSGSGAYEDAGQQSLGFKGKTLDYRKIQNLELDELFNEYLALPIFQEICRHVYGENRPISLFRAMFMNKPANKGTFLPWHQDRWTYLDRDPQITVWTAMDPATVANGCVQVIPGSHKDGLINPEHSSGFLTKPQANAICTPDKIVYVELEPGEVVLLHNYLLHASDVNKSPQSRRAFSVCYMEADTLHNGEKGHYPTAFTTPSGVTQGSADTLVRK